ncbi:GH23624 [Drosophila grimshawi]|uniref:GH23624 n=1 Tax=Drosophila grimshawi TaxID=7222 RepID=B4K324_DROGR|nr:GH23624 [Drosophila grimshawi]
MPPRKKKPAELSAEGAQMVSSDDDTSLSSDASSEVVVAKRKFRPQPCTGGDPMSTMSSAPEMPPPVETWSLVVRSKTAGKSAKDVVEKVVKDVGPTLGVRMHEVKSLRDGGAIIRTPSVAERKKIAGNAKCSEVGLEASVRERLGPKVVVQGVHSVISLDEFMAEDKMSKEAFTKDVRIASKRQGADNLNLPPSVVSDVDPLLDSELEVVKEITWSGWFYWGNV